MAITPDQSCRQALYAMRTIVALGLEGTFEKRYSSSLTNARRATVRNATVFALCLGAALSAYLIMMAVATIYGAFMLAAEMDESSFDVITMQARPPPPARPIPQSPAPTRSARKRRARILHTDLLAWRASGRSVYRLLRQPPERAGQPGREQVVLGTSDAVPNVVPGGPRLLARGRGSTWIQ